MTELLSIIVPVYNASEYLDECISSIISQTYSNFELLLINDGSTDKSLEICNKFKKYDKRIIVIDKKNTGVSDSRNVGLSLAKGKYIGFVDSDDCIEKEMYQILIHKIQLEKTQVCAMTNYTIRFPKLNNELPIDNIEALKKIMLLQFPTSVWAYLYTAQILKDISFSKDIHFFEDLEFNYRVLSNAKKVSRCMSNLYNYRYNETSINSQAINYKKLSCLKLIDSLVEDINRNNTELKEVSKYFVSHCLLSMILSVSKSQEKNNDFYSMINKYCVMYMNKIIRAKHIPFNQKLIIYMYRVSPRVVTKSIFFLKYRNKLKFK